LPKLDQFLAQVPKAYEPCDKIAKPLPSMRHETVVLVRHATAGNLRAYVLVITAAKGTPPQTVQALADQL
jgi:hypothetical protein